MTQADGDVRVRAASEQDCEPLLEFIEPFVRKGRLLRRTAVELTDLVRHGFVAEAHGGIVGFAALEIYSAKLGEVRSLAVADGWQGHGIGKQLVHACVNRAREHGVLEVMAITSSEEFFRGCGFDFTLPGEKKALFVHTRPMTPEEEIEKSTQDSDVED